MRRQADFRSTTDSSFSALIVCDHASAKFGGEAILPLHYFRLLRNRGLEVWLVTHARTRAELTELFPGERRILYVEETLLHTLLWNLGKLLPPTLAYATTGFLLRLGVQVAQRRIVRRLVAREGIDLVHQPTPVSPREPSIIYDVGAPVIIGPMNGGMDYPPAFRAERPWYKKLLLRIGVSQTPWLNKADSGQAPRRDPARRQRAHARGVAEGRVRHGRGAGRERRRARPLESEPATVVTRGRRRRHFRLRRPADQAEGRRPAARRLRHRVGVGADAPGRHRRRRGA